MVNSDTLLVYCEDLDSYLVGNAPIASPQIGLHGADTLRGQPCNIFITNLGLLGLHFSILQVLAKDTEELEVTKKEHLERQKIVTELRTAEVYCMILEFLPLICDLR